jgi:hypothetical protein
MTRLSFFVDLGVPLAEFRTGLVELIPGAVIVREFSATRVVVVVPADTAHLLTAVAGATRVTPDELNHTLRRGRPGLARD